MLSNPVSRFLLKRNGVVLGLKVYGLLSNHSKRRIRAIIPVYVSLAILDLIGVILLASCGTIAFNLISGDTRPSRIELFLRNNLKIEADSSTLIFSFAILAAIFLISKTLLNTLVNYRMTKWLANQESTFSTNLFTSLLRAPLSEIRKISIGDAQWAIMIGSSRIISGVVAPLVAVLGDFISIVVLLTTLVFATPEVTFILVLILILSQKLYSYWLRGRLTLYGNRTSDSASSLNEEIIQSFNAVKEIKIYSLTEPINEYFKRERQIISTIAQKSAFLNNLFRYYLETIILFSAFFVVVFELYTSDIRRALTSLVLFMSVGLRIIPSLQRFQAITMSLQLSQGMTKSFFAMTERLKSFEQEKSSHSIQTSLEVAGRLGLSISELSCFIDGDAQNHPVLNNISLEVAPGALVAIVGASGSGKTTLVDHISGLLKANRGSVHYVDENGFAFEPRSDLVGYCAQSPYIFDTSIEDNLRISGINIENNFISSMIHTLNLTNLSERIPLDNEITLSRRISGGERQRIGIARVFLSNRPILVFDEPTSALDQDNATQFLQLLHRNRGTKTQFVVTHDIALAKQCDLLLVLEAGTLSFEGKPTEYFVA